MRHNTGRMALMRRTFRQSYNERERQGRAGGKETEDVLLSDSEVMLQTPGPDDIQESREEVPVLGNMPGDVPEGFRGGDMAAPIGRLPLTMGNPMELLQVR